MSNPLVHAFFIGRAVAELVNEQLEYALTNALSDLGRFDAEQRERLRQFTEQVMERARREEELAMASRPASSSSTSYTGSYTGGNYPDNFGSGDLQATIDDLRAEIARLRSELQRYRNRT